METKQNAKPLTIEEQIEFLWKSDTHIPFMQSREILGYGYIEGFKSGKASVTKLENNDSPSPLIGKPKKIIENKYADNEIKKVEEKSRELDIEQAKYDLLDVIIKTIETTSDLISIYQFVKDEKNSVSKKLQQLKAKNNTSETKVKTHTRTAYDFMR